MTEASFHDDLTWLQQLARSLLRDPGLADDVCQEALLAAQRQAPDQRLPRAWLAEAVRRIARGFERARIRRLRRELAGARSEATPSTDELVARRELHERLSRSVLTLPEPYRTTTLLRYQENWPVARIAASQDCPADTVRWRLRRALQMLRQDLEAEFGPDCRGLILATAPAPFTPPGLVASFRAALAHCAPKTVAGSLIVSNAKIVTLTALVFLTATGLWFLVQENPHSHLPGETNGRAAAVVTAPKPESPIEHRSNEARAEPAPGPERRASTHHALSTDAELATLLGRIRNQQGTPMSGVTIRAHSQNRWTRETSSDDEGCFRLQLPREPHQRIWVRVEPDLFHTSRTLLFGPDRKPPEHSLGSTPRDVGDIVLEPAGCLRGWLRTPPELSLQRAVILLDGSRAGGWAEKDGSFVLGHVPPGNSTLHVHAPGFKILSREFTVRAGATTSVELHLEPGFLLRGRVVDENGEGVHDIALYPSAGYHFAHELRTEADGSFRLRVPDERPVGIEVADARYEQLGDPNTEFHPGADEIRIRVREILPELALRILDARDDRAIERFRLRVLRHAGKDGTFALRHDYEASTLYDAREGGRMDVRARSGTDLLAVEAPGYQDWRGAPMPDDNSPGRQTIRLKASTRVTGQILRDGRPVIGARVFLQQAAFHVLGDVRSPQDERPPKPDFGGCRPKWWMISYYHQMSDGMPSWSCYPRGGVLASTTTDEHGYFALDPREAEAAMLIVEDDSGPRLCKGPLRPGREQDFGQLTMPRSVQVRGLLRPDHPTALAGHRIEILGQDNSTFTTDAEGKFTLSVAPGALLLSLHPATGTLVVPDARCIRANYFVHVPDKDAFELTLPLLNEPCTVLNLELRSDTECDGARLELVPLAGGAPHVLEDGTRSGADIEWTVPVLGPSWLEAVFAGRRHRLLPEPLDCRSGAQLRARAHFQRSSLLLCRPTWPDGGSLELRATGASGSRVELELRFDGAGQKGTGAELAQRTARGLRLDELPVGSFALSATLRSPGGQELWSYSENVSLTSDRILELDASKRSR